MNYVIKTYFFILLAGVFAFTGLKTEEVKYKGVAQQMGNELYSETHQEFYENGKHSITLTEYYDTKGNVIVKRKADFRKNKISPDFVTEDLRTGHFERSEYLSKNSYKITYKKSKEYNTREEVIDLPQGTVIDAGINYFVRENWEKIQAKKSLVFNFAVPARLTYYAFVLTNDGDCVVNGLSCTRIKMEPDNFMLKKIVDPIYMCYDSKSKRMVSYEGISNIRDEKSKTIIVKINYPDLGP